MHKRWDQKKKVKQSWMYEFSTHTHTHLVNLQQQKQNIGCKITVMLSGEELFFKFNKIVCRKLRCSNHHLVFFVMPDYVNFLFDKARY